MKHSETIDEVERRLRLHLLPVFGHLRASQISTAQVERYKVKRLEQAAKPGTVNRELELMKHAYLLGKIRKMPEIQLLAERNIRKGFFERYQLDAICRHLPSHLVPIARFGYITGWRHEEVTTLTLGHVHFDPGDTGEVRLEPGETKNDEGRTFPWSKSFANIY